MRMQWQFNGAVNNIKNMLDSLSPKAKIFIENLVRMNIRNIEDAQKFPMSASVYFSMDIMRIKNISMLKLIAENRWDKFPREYVFDIIPLIEFQRKIAQNLIVESENTDPGLREIYSYSSGLINSLNLILTNTQLQ